MSHRILRFAVAALAVGVLTVPVGASDPVGIYAVVNKVVFEPDECAPTRVQVWGAFSKADNQSRGYANVETGYLYYVVPKGPESNGVVCQREWMDLKAVAGTGEVVGFGTRWGSPLGRVRRANLKVEDPDPYPMNNGVWRITQNRMAVGDWYPSLISALRKAAGSR